jgi:peptidoglycan-associated lipoprotein
MNVFSQVLRMSFVMALGLTLAACSAKRGAGDGADGAYGSDASAGIGLGTLERVFFEFDSSTITPASAATLKKNADVMKSNSRMRTLVEGHTDERGTAEYNIALGERRARAAMDYLVSLGIARNRLDMKSWGEERPLDFGQTEDAFRKNRRAEFVILSK